jgi:hypothetical protein
LGANLSNGIRLAENIVRKAFDFADELYRNQGLNAFSGFDLIDIVLELGIAVFDEVLGIEKPLCERCLVERSIDLAPVVGTQKECDEEDCRDGEIVRGSTSCR